jgi:hypothetical protein
VWTGKATDSAINALIKVERLRVYNLKIVETFFRELSARRGQNALSCVESPKNTALTRTLKTFANRETWVSGDVFWIWILRLNSQDLRFAVDDVHGLLD